MEGLEFDTASGLFYATQGAEGVFNGVTLTRGLFTVDVFGTGAMTKIADFPAGQTRIDGVAIGGGKVWLTQQTGASNVVQIFPYDLSTGTYGSTISFALADGTNRASGATWAPGAVPEPTTLSLFAGAALIVRRRR